MAATVTGKGFEYQPNCQINCDEYVGPPETVPLKDLALDPSFVDLTGRKKGRFTVIGLMKEKKKGRWLVRCVCGTYTTRSAKSIKGADSNPNAHWMHAAAACMRLTVSGNTSTVLQGKMSIFRRCGNGIVVQIKG
nr:Uncharacterised protein [Escherichia coli]